MPALAESMKSKLVEIKLVNLFLPLLQPVVFIICIDNKIKATCNAMENCMQWRCNVFLQYIARQIMYVQMRNTSNINLSVTLVHVTDVTVTIII